MPIQLPRVKPGDLITSQLLNDLVTQVEAMDVRITALEQLIKNQPGVFIYSILPSSTVTVGSEVRLIGRGFGLASDNVVTIDDSVSVTSFLPGSTDTQLIFMMPLIVFTGGTKAAKIRVSNPRGFFETTFTLTTGTPTSVEATIRFDPPASFQRLNAGGGPNVGSGAIIKFPVKISSNLDETFTLAPVVTGQQGWTASIVDSAGSPRPQELPVQKNDNGTQFEVFVLIQGASTSGQLRTQLTVTSKRNPVKTSAADLAFNVGVPPPATATVSVSLRTANPPARPVGAVVMIPPNASTLSAMLEFDALLPQIDQGGETYTATATINGTGWSVTPPAVDSAPFSTGTGLLFRPAFRITANANTVGPMTLTISVRSKSNPAHFGVLNQDCQIG